MDIVVDRGFSGEKCGLDWRNPKGAGPPNWRYSRRPEENREQSMTDTIDRLVRIPRVKKVDRH